MRIWNLTPHVMQYDDGETQIAYPSDAVVRVQMVETVAAPIGQLRTIYATFAAVEGIPAEVQPGDVLMVSTIVADAMERQSETFQRYIILVPDTGPSCNRDGQGRIISVSRFIRRVHGKTPAG